MWRTLVLKVGLLMMVGLLGMGVVSVDAEDFLPNPSPTTRLLNSVSMVDAHDGWAVGYRGTIVRWDGTRWSNVSSYTTATLNSVHMIDADDGWAVGAFGTIVRWDGRLWGPVTSPTGWGIYSVSMASTNDGWAVGYRGAILRWNGASWKLGLSPTWNSLQSVFMLSENDGWAVGDKGTLVHWNGTKWSNVVSPTTSYLLSVHMVNIDDGWAVGRQGTIIRWNGATWNITTTPTVKDLQSVFMVGADDGWAVGSDGTMVRWDGTDWEIMESPTTTPLGDVFMVNADNGWIVGGEGTILQWTGATYQPEIMVDPLRLDFGSVPVDYPGPINMTTITNVGTDPLTVQSITLTSDGGGTFSIIGIYPEEPPFGLDPDESAFVFVKFDHIGAYVDTYVGAIEVVSNRSIMEVTLLGSSTTASGVTTLHVQRTTAYPSIAYPSAEKKSFAMAIDAHASITRWSVFRYSNVFHYNITQTDDKKITVVGQLEEDDLPAHMILEIRYVNSSEKLAVYELIIAPYGTASATIESCDSAGTPKQIFDLNEPVYVTGAGYAPSTTFAVYLVTDLEIWIHNMPIREHVPDIETQVSSNTEGIIPPTAVWCNPQTLGEYDIILDVNDNGRYDGGIDPLDTCDMGLTGGFIIPEFTSFLPLLLLMAGAIPIIRHEPHDYTSWK